MRPKAQGKNTMSTQPTAQQIVTEIAAATQAQPQQITLFYRDETGALIFDEAANEFQVWIRRPDGWSPDGAATKHTDALQIFALAALKWQRFDAQQPAAQPVAA